MRSTSKKIAKTAQVYHRDACGKQRRKLKIVFPGGQEISRSGASATNAYVHLLMFGRSHGDWRRAEGFDWMRRFKLPPDVDTPEKFRKEFPR